MPQTTKKINALLDQLVKDKSIVPPDFQEDFRQERDQLITVILMMYPLAVDQNQTLPPEKQKEAGRLLKETITNKLEGWIRKKTIDHDYLEYCDLMKTLGNQKVDRAQFVAKKPSLASPHTLFIQLRKMELYPGVTIKRPGMNEVLISGITSNCSVNYADKGGNRGIAPNTWEVVKRPLEKTHPNPFRRTKSKAVVKAK